MLATQERVRKDGRTVVVWHKPVGRAVGEFQAIACSEDEGIVLPGPKKDVPLDLDQPGERWCPDCLATTQSATKEASDG